MTINEIQDKIIEEFSIFEDWMDKYSYLIELGRECPMIDEKDKKENNLIKGCQSKVWVSAELIDGKMVIKADSDAVITKGIVTLLLRVLNNQKPQDVYDANLYFIDQIGLSTHLSPTRSNGLLSMIKQIKLYAIAYTIKGE
ncbi:MAG: SufE family protein [Bacteroidales bacterium]|jgi:cysteine desulfuration protein SufE|nr:SufE family protein [Bacteroidales bacterium]MDD4001432.1 SufE family protein [Bacteroidales bacterium]MDD4529050.1 SufE family protein [Bacteroidales bacterium]MDD4829628.1 SufE family protein [Bacteroidales bacterium]